MDLVLIYDCRIDVKIQAHKIKVNIMREVTVEIIRMETITIKLDIPKEHSRSEIFKKISDDPGSYLENHVDSVVKDTTEFRVASLDFKED